MTRATRQVDTRSSRKPIGEGDHKQADEQGHRQQRQHDEAVARRIDHGNGIVSLRAMRNGALG